MTINSRNHPLFLSLLSFLFSSLSLFTLSLSLPSLWPRNTPPGRETPHHLRPPPRSPATPLLSPFLPYPQSSSFLSSFPSISSAPTETIPPRDYQFAPKGLHAKLRPSGESRRRLEGQSSSRHRDLANQQE